MFRRKGQQAENDKTERVTGLGRRTREAIAKWNQMTALRFQTGGRHQTSLASLQGSGLKETFMQRYIVERTNTAEIRLEEQSEKTESCRDNSWNYIQIKRAIKKETETRT